ncbi:DUF3824 domain-containing protein [Micromonospora sp. CA-263727]|uniref:DUF3824 domain-containing protein n=1 Tax=Micromonospora sp. CA-263727 TaxID=3239967 RepID=UPI003D8F0AC4
MSDQPPPADPSRPSLGEPDPPGMPAAYPGQPPHPGQPYPGQPYPGQPYPGQSYPGQPPYGWYHPAGYGLDPSDVLVTPPGAGLGGWLARCVGAVRRSWQLLLPILVLTQVLPAAALSILALAVEPAGRWEVEVVGDTAELPATFWTDLGVMLGVLVGGGLIIGLVQCAGWAAGTWVIARQAAGEAVSLGAALRYGLRRALGLWAWTLIIALIVTLGACFCLLPGIYAAFALAMVGPVYLFERRDPISRSHRMLLARFGMLLGRLALVFVTAIVVSLVAGVLESVARMPFGAVPLDSPGAAAGVTIVIGVGALLALPAHLAQLVGLVVTYAEQRAHEAPVNSAQLAAELG